MAVIALQAGIACSETERETVEINDGKVVLTVNLDSGTDLSMTTKATLDTDGEKRINGVQIFVFNEDGTLDSYHSGTESRQIKIRCSTGKKKVYSFINAPDLGFCTDSTSLLAQATSLSDNKIGGFVMTGRTSATLPEQSSVNVKVSRIAARVCIKEITSAFTSDGFKNIPFTIKSIYMINVAGDTDYTRKKAPATWYNKSRHSDTSLNTLLYADVSQALAAGSTLMANQYFYVYPNPVTVDSTSGSTESEFTPRFTRLVVEAMMNNETCYYAISLPKLESNKAYSISRLTITRLGSDNPDQEITSEECPFSIEVEDWIETDALDLII